MLRLDTPLTPWTVRLDRDVVAALDGRFADEGTLRADIRGALEEVVTEPLSGTTRRAGGRTVRVRSVAYAVIVWTTDPSAAVSEADVDRVYVHDVVARDPNDGADITGAVSGPQRPAEQSARFGVRIPDYDCADDVSALHAADALRISDEQWSDEGVLVGGEVSGGRHDAVVKTAPDAADVRLGEQVVRA